MLPFDKVGSCTGPRTQKHIVDQVRSTDITDVFVFAHGWNNDWNVATKRYRDFIDGYLGLRRERGLETGRPLNPLLVGVFWPSTALVVGSEEGLRIAGGATDDRAAKHALRHGEVEAVAAELSERALPRFYELLDRDEISEIEALDLKEMLKPLLERTSEDDPAEFMANGDEESQGRQGDPTVATWRSYGAATPEERREDPHKIAEQVADFGRVPAAEPLVGASVLGKLDPRRILRLVTVQLMKDRAGTVGAKGVAPLLVELLGAANHQDTRVHLLGHSYGAKVCLSAVCYPSALPRQVTSMLLLQPAVNHRCFADDEYGRGGYHAALDRVNLPILSTYSTHDWPLRHVFQYAAHRTVDVNEIRIAADGRPDPYSALGGYGPWGLGDRAKLVDVRLPDERYNLGADAPHVYGVRASSTISGHGDINNVSTWWALDNLVTADPRGPA